MILQEQQQESANQHADNNNNNPIWSVHNKGSFASIQVELPPNTEICCETDAVVSFSQGVNVSGQLGSGGILGALARAFLTSESFFTTRVQNKNLQPERSSSTANVLLAPAEPGGIVLHRLSSSSSHDGLYLTSGSYVASDAHVEITSRVQRGSLNNSIFSGTGMFLLYARSSSGAAGSNGGGGTVACAAYGAVHTYHLQQGEIRAVDNGHLVAWTSNMRYTTGLASQGSGAGGGATWGNILDSVTSGEGLMCFFEGPGTLYIQSHKPQRFSENDGRRRTTQGVSPVKVCFLFGILGIFVGVAVVFMVVSSSNLNRPINPKQYHHYQRGGYQREF